MAAEITLHDVYQQLQAQPEAQVIVDIRDPQSFSQGHIPGSVRLDNNNVAEFLANTEAETPVIVVCYHGVSSHQAADVLSHNGLNQVVSMQGGFTAWQTQFPDSVEQG